LIDKDKDLKQQIDSLRLVNYLY